MSPVVTIPPVDAKKWEQTVHDAKLVVASRENNQMKIAELALSVCEITWGGTQKSAYTLTRFSEEIGIPAKRLSAWIAIKRNVFDKISTEMKKQSSFTDWAYIAKHVTRNTPREAVEKHIFKRVNVDAFDHKLLRYCANIKGLLYNFEYHNAFLRAQPETLQEIKFYIETINNGMEGIEALNHGLSAAHSSYEVSASSTLGERKWKINDNDRRVLELLTETKTWWSPTDIGLKLSGLNKSSSSAWALRSLFKYLNLGKVEKNDRSQYRARIEEY